MITVRPSNARGHFDHGWLDTRHTFSFADYHDEAHMGFRALRVINEDVVAPGQGFGTHGHRDMEIVTWPLSGKLAHKDSTGGGSVLEAGMAQRMTAGTGVQHSEFNGSQTEPVHFMQIWLVPDRRGLAPSYEEKRFPAEERKGVLRVIASPDAREGSLKIHADATVRAGVLDAKPVTVELAAGRHAWVQVLRGGVELNGTKLAQGDGARVSDERTLTLAAADGEAEVLVFDLA